MTREKAALDFRVDVLVLFEPALGPDFAPEGNDVGGARCVCVLVHDTSRSRLFLAQGAAQDLADVRFRQFMAEFDVARHLVAGEARAQEFAQLVFGHLGLFPDGEQLWHFAGMAVGHADHRAFQQAAMGHGEVLDLVGEYLEPGHRDHVLLAVDDAHAALLVHHADVAGAQETVDGHDLGGLVGAVPITGHHLRAARADFALVADRHFMTAVVADGDLGRWHRQADGAGPFVNVAAVAGEHRRGLRQAITFDDRMTGRLHPGFGHRLLHRHAAADGIFEQRPVELAEIGMMQQRVEQRVHRRKGVHIYFARVP